MNEPQRQPMQTEVELIDAVLLSADSQPAAREKLELQMSDDPKFAMRVAERLAFLQCVELAAIGLEQSSTEEAPVRLNESSIASGRWSLRGRAAIWSAALGLAGLLAGLVWLGPLGDESFKQAQQETRLTHAPFDLEEVADGWLEMTDDNAVEEDWMFEGPSDEPLLADGDGDWINEAVLSVAEGSEV